MSSSKRVEILATPFELKEASNSGFSKILFLSTLRKLLKALKEKQIRSVSLLFWTHNDVARVLAKYRSTLGSPPRFWVCCFVCSFC